jgi:hypothetical protein
LRIEGGGDDGAINLEIGDNHWRVINNILTAATARETARSGCVTGDGIDAVILGNTIAEVDAPDPGLQNHGIYIDGPGSYRVGYNYIHDVPGGSGFQVYGDETPTGSTIANDVLFDHNWGDHVTKYCVNLSDNSGSRFRIYDNVSAYCGMAGLRINSPVLHDARIYNNTFFAGDDASKPDFGVIVVDSKLQGGALDIRNNIFMPAGQVPYMGGDNPLIGPTPSAHFSNDLYFGGTGAHSFDSASVSADPGFFDSGSCDFHLNLASPAPADSSLAVRALVLDDFKFTPHQGNRSYDIGGYSHDE